MSARRASSLTGRARVDSYRVTLPNEHHPFLTGGATAALLARYSTTPIGNATAFAHSLIDVIEDDPRVYSDVLLATANRRDPAVRARRAQLFSLASRTLARCYDELLADPNAQEILEAERTRQEFGLALAAGARAHDTERALTRLSDLLAACRDPVYRTARHRRRGGLLRRPDDGLPLFVPARPVGRTGMYVGLVDVLEWEWLDLAPLRIVDADGETYDELVPMMAGGCDAEPIIPFSVFAMWQRRSLACQYKIAERKVARGGRRVVREVEPIIGLHEDARGRLVVDLRLYLLDQIARRTGAWSAAARDAQTARSRARCEVDDAETRTASVPLTRTEKLLRQLEREGADVEYLRRLWEPQIEEERRLEIYA